MYIYIYIYIYTARVYSTTCNLDDERVSQHCICVYVYATHMCI